MRPPRPDRKKRTDLQTQNDVKNNAELRRHGSFLATKGTKVTKTV